GSSGTPNAGAKQRMCTANSPCSTKLNAAMPEHECSTQRCVSAARLGASEATSDSLPTHTNNQVGPLQNAVGAGPALLRPPSAYETRYAISGSSSPTSFASGAST